MVDDIVTSVDLNGLWRIGNIDNDLSDAASDYATWIWISSIAFLLVNV